MSIDLHVNLGTSRPKLSNFNLIPLFSNEESTRVDSRCLLVSLSRFLVFSLSRCLVVALSPCLVVSLSRCLVFSLSPCLVVSFSRFLVVALSRCLVVSLSHCLLVSCTRLLIGSPQQKALTTHYTRVHLYGWFVKQIPAIPFLLRDN